MRQRLPLPGGQRLPVEVGEVLPAAELLRLQLEAVPFREGATAFVAGRAFLEYRRRGGARTAPLPDFYIGAHAAVAGYRLLTRDARRYRAYFARLELIAPD